MASEETRNSQTRIQVLDRIVGVLDILAREGPEYMLIEISKGLGLHKSTVHRLLVGMEEHRLVERNPINGKYRLGLRLFELGSKAVKDIDLRDRARPHLGQLVAETGETAHLCILDDGMVVYLEKVESHRTMRVPSIVGHRYPAHCGAAGKSLLAFLTDGELEDIVRRHGLNAFTRNTITTLPNLKHELRLVRERGYALDNEEFEEGLRCIGAPVRDYSEKVVAAISVAGPAFRLTEGKLPHLVQLIGTAANKLSGELGYREVDVEVVEHV